MSKNASDKLAKLAGFGKMAGEAPAAAAREAMNAAAAPSPQVNESVAAVPLTPQHRDAEHFSEKNAASSAAPKESTNPVPAKVTPPFFEEANLTRNIIFLPADQIELDRLEDILRLAGIRKPTLADLVRVALRSANPNPQEAADFFRAAKVLDGRRRKE